MNENSFALVAHRIRERAGEDDKYFSRMKLLNWDEQSRQITIQFDSEYNINRIKARYSHDVVNAFEQVLGEPVTVICTPNRSHEPPPPHERFKILST